MRQWASDRGKYSAFVKAHPVPFFAVAGLLRSNAKVNQERKQIRSRERQGNTPMRTTPQDAKAIVASLAALLALSAPLFAQAMPLASPAGSMKPMPRTSGTGAGDKGDKMGDMMKMGGMMQKMQADTKAMDVELDGLVITMNQATGSDKMDAMAAVITKMAQQRKTMDQKMAAMQKSMMQGMMGGGMMGGMGSGMKMPSTTEKPMTMDPSMTMPPSK